MTAQILLLLLLFLLMFDLSQAARMLNARRQRKSPAGTAIPTRLSRIQRHSMYAQNHTTFTPNFASLKSVHRYYRLLENFKKR